MIAWTSSGPSAELSRIIKASSRINHTRRQTLHLLAPPSQQVMDIFCADDGRAIIGQHGRPQEEWVALRPPIPP